MSHHSISIVNPLKVLSGFMFVLPQRDSSGRRVIFHIPRSSMLVLNQSCIIAYFNVFTKKNFFTIRLLDTSHHSMEDVIKVIAITLETLLEDNENQIRYVVNYNNVVLDWFPSFDVFLFRGLSCIVDANNLSLAHMTFWNPIEVQSLKSWSQRHH